MNNEDLLKLIDENTNIEIPIDKIKTNNIINLMIICKKYFKNKTGQDLSDEQLMRIPFYHNSNEIKKILNELISNSNKKKL